MAKFIIDDYLYDTIQQECPEIDPRIIKFSSGLQSCELDKVAVILEEEDFFYLKLKEVKLDHVSYCGEMDEDKINIIESKFNEVNELFLSIKNEFCLFTQLSISIPLLEEIKTNITTYGLELSEIERTLKFNENFVSLYQTKIDEYLKRQNDIFSLIFENVKFGKLGERIND